MRTAKKRRVGWKRAAANGQTTTLSQVLQRARQRSGATPTVSIRIAPEDIARARGLAEKRVCATKPISRLSLIHIYGLFGALGAPPALTRFDYQGDPTSVYTFSGTPEVPAMLLGAGGSFYGLSLTNNTDVYKRQTPVRTAAR